MGKLDFTLVGLAGKKYAGKSTVARYLEEHYFFSIFSFATPIKLGAKAMFGYTNKELTDPILKEQLDTELGFSPRQAMQALGTEGVRNALGVDVWIKLMNREVESMRQSLYPHNRVVIDDVRFDNEANYIRKQGGQIIHIINPNEPKSHAADPHQSENGIQHHMDDIIFTNNKFESRATFELKLHQIAIGQNWPIA